MNIDEFWKLIASARQAGNDDDERVEELESRLVELPAGEIQEFQRHLDERMAESYRWDLWAVAYIINGGCSDDGFHYFRGWLILQGRKYFEDALNEAEHAADRAATDSDAHECEELLYVARRAYEVVTGNEMPDTTGVTYPPEPVGTAWEEEDLPELYPELSERFAG